VPRKTSFLLKESIGVWCRKNHWSISQRFYIIATCKYPQSDDIIQEMISYIINKGNKQNTTGRSRLLIIVILKVLLAVHPSQQLITNSYL